MDVLMNMRMVGAAALQQNTYQYYSDQGEVDIINAGSDVDPNDPNGDNWNPRSR